MRKYRYVFLSVLFVIALGAIPASMIWLDSQGGGVQASRPELVIEPKLNQESIRSAPLLNPNPVPITECLGAPVEAMHLINIDGTNGSLNQLIESPNDTIEGGYSVVIVASDTDLSFNDVTARVCLIGDRNRLDLMGGINDFEVTGDDNQIISGNTQVLNMPENQTFAKIDGNGNTLTLIGDNFYEEQVSTVDITGNNNSVIGSLNIEAVTVAGDNNNVSTGGIGDNEGNGIYDAITVVSGSGNTVDAGLGGSIVDNGTGTLGNIPIVADGQDVQGTDGDDSIYLVGSDSKIDGKKGNDTLSIIGFKCDIKGREGDDIILAIGDECKVEADEGNDVVTASGFKLDLKGNKGDDIFNVRGDDAKVEMDEGFNILDFVGTKADIKGKEDGNQIVAIGDEIKIDTKDGADIIYLVGSDCDIKTGKGNDIVQVEAGDNCKIDTDEGIDVVTVNVADNIEVKLGKGDDDIEITADNSTIDGGDGTDICIVTGSNNTIENCEQTVRRAPAPAPAIERIEGSRIFLPLIQE